GKGFPLYSRIEIAGRPGGPIFTNPGTGAYSVELAADSSYTFTTKAEFPGYQTVLETVPVGSTNLTHNIAIPVDNACIAAGYAVGFGAPVISESFSTLAQPPGWTVVNRTASGGWRFNDPKPRGNLTGGTDGFAIMDSDFFGVGNTQDSDLIPPALDLSGLANPYVRFNSDYRAFSNGFADIDYSFDGGTTWTNVWHQTTVSRRGPIVEAVPLTGAGGHADVLVRFHYRGTFAWWWEVDNVEVVNRSCDPQPGGLVLGLTTDQNTGAGLVGVTVTSLDRPAEKAVSAPTPADPNLPDGFYWLFSSLTGAHPFTAAKAPYLPQTVTVGVADNGTTRQDFALKAGRVAVTPGSIEASVPWNGSATRTVTLSNTGTAPATVDILERTGSFEILGQTGARLVMQRVKGDVSKGMTGTPSAEVTGPSPAVDDSWTTIKSYPMTVLDNVAATNDGKVYAVGGGSGTTANNRAHVYDPVLNTWTALPNMPVGRAKPATAFVDGKLYVLGGWNSSGVPIPSVDVFDPAAGTWSTMSGVTNPMPTAAAAVAVADGKVYLVGGCLNSSCTATAGTLIFTPATGAFGAGASYPHTVAWLSCGAISGTVYCGGGVDAASFKDAHAYHPSSNSWSALPDMPLDLWGSAHTSASGLLVIMGGVTANLSTVTNRSVAYDPATNTWINLPNAQFARYRGGGACGAYKVGGASGGFTGTADTERLGGLDQCNVA
ncbi:MAG TPA: kelch repeat-containing protein, partial [Micromonosporaceae bacterium]|nr:kelch repeat-containing protein [Micromonosporaceae bacterium]